LADASFDVVVIGGGQQGLVISNYLACNGMTVGLFEQRQELGGCAASDPSPAAGFIGNPHAEYLGFWNSPVNQDFRLHEKGLSFIFPEVQGAMVYPNDKCLVAYTSVQWDKETGMITPQSEMIEKNIKEVARISSRDAETLAKLAEKRFFDWFMAILQHLYNPPPLPGEPDPIENLLNDPKSGLHPSYQFMTEMEVLSNFFESAELKAFCITWNHYNFVYADDVAPIPMALLPLATVFGVSGMSLARGGTHSVAHALQRALSEQGGEFFVGADVDKVLVEHGRARGIRLADGTEIEAKKLVIDSAGVEQVINRHLREVPLSSDIRRKVNKLRHDRGQVFWGQLAIHEPPRYRAESWNPDVGKALWLRMGDPDVEYLFREYRYQAQHISPGHWPSKMYPTGSVNSLLDPSYSPAGKYLAQVGEGCGPLASWLSEREWMQVKKEFADVLLEEWQKYAPNMTWDNVVAVNIGTPYDHQQRNANFVEGDVQPPAITPSQWGKYRPIPELAQYHVPGIESFYLASGHHNVGLLGCSGYNCYKRIAQKLGLKKPWEGRLL